MTLIEVRLVNHDLEPGWSLVSTDIPSGKPYTIDIEQVEELTLHDLSTGREQQVRCVWVVAPGDPGWLPLMVFGL